jgi:hypothetical protein
MLAARLRTIATWLWFLAATGTALATVAIALTARLPTSGPYIAVGFFLVLLAALFGAWAKAAGGHTLGVAFWAGLIWTIATSWTFVFPDEPWSTVRVGLTAVGFVAAIASGVAWFVRPAVLPHPE